MLDQTLVRGGKGLRIAELPDDDHPTAGQLMGSHPADIAAGAKVLLNLGYDAIDVNLACPVKKVRKKSRGGHLMCEPEQACAILDAVRQSVGDAVPCTVKLRRGTDDSAVGEANFHRIFAGAMALGYAAATVHARTVVQKYIGPSRWEFLGDLVRRYGLGPASRGTRTFTLFGSGDIWTARDIFRMIEQTGVDGVSVARGCIGNPWLFTQARALVAGDTRGGERPPTLGEQRAVLLEHFALSVRINGELMAARMMRKFGIRFARHHPASAEVARAFIAVHCLQDWHAVVDDYYAPSEPGALVPTGRDGDVGAGVIGVPAFSAGA
jgi:tRNA-dihydrouridine synthase